MTQDEYIEILFRQCNLTIGREKDIFVGVTLRKESSYILELSSLTMREKSTLIARLRDRKNQLQLFDHTSKTSLTPSILIT